MKSKILCMRNNFIELISVVISIVGAIIIILIAIAIFYFAVMFLFPVTKNDYSECNIRTDNTIYILKDVTSKQLKYYDNALHFYHNENDVTLTNYEMKCKPL